MSFLERTDGKAVDMMRTEERCGEEDQDGVVSMVGTGGRHTSQNTTPSPRLAESIAAILVHSHAYSPQTHSQPPVMPIFTSRSQAALVLALLSSPFISFYIYRRSKHYYATPPHQRYFFHPPLPIPTVPSTSPHPPTHFLSTPHLVTRFLYYVLPIPLQHSARDHGLLGVSDVLALLFGPLAFLPWQARLLWQHMKPSAWPARVRYGTVGELSERTVEVHNAHRRENGAGSELSPIVVFTHGGAWGSGSALMYRLLSSCFDQQLHCVHTHPQTITHIQQLTSNSRYSN